jgi:hypothetical protein
MIMIISFFMIFVRVVDNVLGIAEVGAFEKRQFKFSTKADRSTNIEVLPSALLLPNPC